MNTFSLKLIIFLFIAQSGFSQISSILSMKDRAKTIDRILELRVKNLLPELMKRENIDMWVIISREYNEDPIIKTLLPSTWISARRRTILVFNRSSNDSIEAFAVARYMLVIFLKRHGTKTKSQINGKD